MEATGSASRETDGSGSNGTIDLNNEAFARQLQEDMAALLGMSSVPDITSADMTGPDSNMLDDADEVSPMFASVFSAVNCFKSGWL